MHIEATAETATEALVNKGKPKKAKKTAPIEATTEVGATEGNLIEEIAHDIENMSADVALTKLGEIQDDVGLNQFYLGGLLALVQSNEYWKAGGGHANFKAFIEDKYGIQYRKAMYLISIYTNLVNSGVHWNQVSAVGWTKLKEIAHLLTKDNVEEWVKTALSCSTLQLREYVKVKTQGISAVDGPEIDIEQTKVTTKTFKLHADQKEMVEAALDLAKHQVGTEFDAVALEAICMDFAGKGGAAKGTSAAISPEAIATVEGLKAVMSKMALADVLAAVEQAFPEANITVEV